MLYFNKKDVSLKIFSLFKMESNVYDVFFVACATKLEKKYLELSKHVVKKDLSKEAIFPYIFFWKKYGKSRDWGSIGEHEANINIQNWVSSQQRPLEPQFNQITLQSPHSDPKIFRANTSRAQRANTSDAVFVSFHLSSREPLMWDAILWIPHRAWHKINGRSSNKILRVYKCVRSIHYIHTHRPSAFAKIRRRTHLSATRADKFTSRLGLNQIWWAKSWAGGCHGDRSHHICPHLGAHDYVP